MHFGKSSFTLLVLPAAALLLVSGCAVRALRESELTREAWTASVLGRLSLERKIAQMVMARSYGYYYSTRSDEFRRVERLVKAAGVGGLACFQGEVLETASLINRLQEISDVPLLVASDFEWGAAMRIRRATRFPEAMAMGAARDTSLAFRMGAATGEEARALGVHIDFAPVADVNVNPLNPVINTRSFGEDPVEVGEMAAAFAAGLRSRGVLATAKHFPGHGDTQVDSHLDLPVIEKERQRLDEVELLPFERLIERDIPSVMVAHIGVPAVEGSSTLPASLSPEITTGLLRGQMRFHGLVFTDALNMGAILKNVGPDSAAVLAVEAGADILLVPADEERAIAAVARAVRSGRISQSRIDSSLGKILRAKWDLGLSRIRTVDVGEIPEIVGTPSHLALAKEIARRSVTVVKNDSLLPLEHLEGVKVLNILITDAENYRTEIHRPESPWPNEPAGDYLTGLLRRRTPLEESIHLDPSACEEDYTRALEEASRSDLVICSLFSKFRSGSGGENGLAPELAAFLDSLTSLQKNTALLALGSPYPLGAHPGARALLATYSDAEVSTEAAVEALFGEIPLAGKLPVGISPEFPRGTGLEIPQAVLRSDPPTLAGADRDSLLMVDSLMLRAVRDSAFPGAQVLALKSGAIVYSRSFGRMEYSSGSQRVTAATMYDLASLTKVVATTSALMRLYEEGRYSLDDPVIRFIPQFASHGKGQVTIRNLLLHNGGLPAFKNLFLTCRSPEEVLDSVYQTAPIYPAWDSTVYSDFDFIVLGKIVEALSGRGLDSYVDSVFYRPLGMSRTMFRPPDSLKKDIAPTEVDSFFRRDTVRGVVHDENAYALGGVSGHAGLFSNASDLAVFMQMITNGGTYGGRQYLKGETIALFTKRQGGSSSRALGWDTKTMNGYSSAGTWMGRGTFGHTGFTGTSLWADPERKVVIILLTNRVFPTRRNTKIMEVRPALHDALMRALFPRPR